MWVLGVVGVEGVRGCMSMNICLEVFAIGVTLFWLHFFVQIFYEYIVWKGLLLGGHTF